MFRTALADADAKGFERGRADADCEKASLLDCINTELRGNHADIQAVMTDDPCTAIRHLVDAAKRWGRDEAKAEAAEIAKSIAKQFEDSGQRYSGFESDAAMGVANAIIATSTDSYEQRVRAEIAEAVGALKRWHPENKDWMVDDGDGLWLERSTVLAAISRGEK